MALDFKEKKKKTDTNKVPASGRVLLDFFKRLENGKEIFFYHVRTVADLMATDFEPVNLDSILKDIWQKMIDEGINNIPVVENDENSDSVVYVGAVLQMEIATLFSRFIGALSQPASDDRAAKVRLSNANAVDREIPTLSPETDIMDAVATMIEHNVDTLAVVNEQKHLLGVLKSADIVSSFEYLELIEKARTEEQTQELRIVDLFSGAGGSMPTDKMLGTFVGTAKEVMRETVPTILITASIGDAARLLESAERRTAVVVDADSKIKGIVTASEIQLTLPPILKRAERVAVKSNSDLFQMNPESTEARTTLAEKVGMVTMTSPAIVKSDTPILAIARTLCNPDAAEMPVLSPDGSQIVGIIGREDMLKAFAALGGLAKKRGLLDE